MFRHTLSCAALAALTWAGACAAPRQPVASAPLGTLPIASPALGTPPTAAGTTSGGAASQSDARRSGKATDGEPAGHAAPSHAASTAPALKSGRVPVNGGFFSEMLPQQAAVGAAMADAMKATPMYRSYAAVAPHPEDSPKLLDRMGAYMRKPFDWRADIRSLKMPTLLVYGDADMYRPEHIVEFYKLLGGVCATLVGVANTCRRTAWRFCRI